MTNLAFRSMWQYYLRNWWPRTYFNRSWQAQERLGNKWAGIYSLAQKEVLKCL